MGNSESSAAGGNRPPQKILQGRTPNTICHRKLLRSFILWIIPKSCGAEGVEGASGKPPLAYAEAKSLHDSATL